MLGGTTTVRVTVEQEIMAPKSATVPATTASRRHRAGRPCSL
jgi:hypothetical protein